MESPTTAVTLSTPNPTDAPDQSSRRPDRLEQKFAEARRLARLDASQQALFGRLSALRAGLAADSGLPAYQVLTNRQLLALCEAPPRTVAEMAERHGVSRVKLLAFGEDLLGVILRRELASEPPNAPSPQPINISE